MPRPDQTDTFRDLMGNMQQGVGQPQQPQAAPQEAAPEPVTAGASADILSQVAAQEGVSSRLADKLAKGSGKDDEDYYKQHGYAPGQRKPMTTEEYGMH